MTNLLTVLPDFDSAPFTHILPSLEKALITTADLLTLEPIDIAKRGHVPAGEVKKLADALLEGLRDECVSKPIDGKAGESDAGRIANSPFTGGDQLSSPRAISTLDGILDERLNGGIHPGYLTEVTGERLASPSFYAFLGTPN